MVTVVAPAAAAVCTVAGSTEAPDRVRRGSPAATAPDSPPACSVKVVVAVAAVSAVANVPCAPPVPSAGPGALLIELLQSARADPSGLYAVTVGLLNATLPVFFS